MDWGIVTTINVNLFIKLTVWIGLAGLINSLGQYALVTAMNIGHKGVSCAVVQAAILFPFLTSILVWKESISIFGLFGIFAFITAIVLMGFGRKEVNSWEKKSGEYKWIFLIVCALLLIGIAQTFQAVPSQWEGWKDEGNLRVCLLLTSSAIGYTLLSLLNRPKITTSALKYGVVWSILALLVYIFLFSGLDYLAKSGTSYLAYPVAQATCMTGFSVYSFLKLRKHFSTPVRIGLACNMIGIIMMGMR